MWLLAYWWQGLILIALYTFIFLIYKKMFKEEVKEPAAFLLVVNTISEKYNWPSGQLILLYPEKSLEFEGDKVYVENEKIIFNCQGNLSKEITPGEIFDFAGGSLQLMRWNNAR